MARFCEKCGTQLRDTSSFCTVCGTQAPPMPAPVPSAPAPGGYQPVQGAPAAVPFQPVQQTPYTQPGQEYVMPPQNAVPAGYGPPPASAVKGGSGLKILLVILVILGLGLVTVVGGIWYVGHRIVSKVKDAAASVGVNTDDLNTSDLSRQGHAFHGDACRFLSKAEVGAAIGMTITEAKSSADSCEYQARGTPSEMTAKHMSMMAGRRGADKKTQETMQKLMGGLMSSQVDPKDAAGDAAEGDVTVLAISIDENAARTQMKLNSQIFGRADGIGGPQSGSGPVEGIGDEAFVSVDGMMMVRKGDTLIRFMYTGCPCGTEQVKPLAKKLVAAL